MLQLRQIIDEVLDIKNLDFLHLEREPKSGQPVLTSQCGKPIITLVGVSLPVRLTSKEREYAAELITGYINEREEDILWMIEIKRNPIDLDGISQYNIGANRSYNYRRGEETELLGFTLEDAKFSVHYSTKNNEYLCSVSGEIPPEVLAARLDKLDLYKSEIAKYQEHYMLKMEEDKRIQEISQCQV